MNLMVNGRHVNVTDAIRTHLDEKVRKLERYLPRLDEVQVELSENETRSVNDRFTCQLTVWDHRNIIRSEETNSTLFAAIDAAVKKLSNRIERVRGRQKNHQRESLVTNTEAALAATLDRTEPEPEGRLVRRKVFRLPPMNEEEAIEQMELLGHNFFLFMNSDGNVVNLVYRRDDGNYGLLQPMLD